MFSGTTLTNLSGHFIGAHQKINKMARHRLDDMKPVNNFPEIKQILHFEGKNGPDGIKRKSPAKDEPWHYLDPFNESDTELVDLIGSHYALLVAALKDHNTERASFEAAWLSHAIVDGLTPAHHYPYEEKLSELRGGAHKDSRNSIKNKLVLPGSTKGNQISNNWKMWGPKGLLTTHGMFEFGVSAMLVARRFARMVPDHEEIDEFNKYGVKDWFRIKAKQIASLRMYDKFVEQGWTPSLANRARHDLIPEILKSVTMVWYQAAVEAES